MLGPRTQGYRILQHYRGRAGRLPLGELSGIFLLVGVDTYQRYRSVASEIPEGTVLDVGAGGKSFLSLTMDGCVSVDRRKLWGLDVVASATHLPFRSHSVDYVASVDTIEHIPRPHRDIAIEEMKRVAREAVVIHVPVENGAAFAGRRYDIAFGEWHKRVKGSKEKNVEEHITNIEPSTQELEEHGFTLRGTHNVELWLSYMRLSYSFKWPLGPILGQFYYFFKKNLDNRPPFWGAVATYREPLVDSAALRRGRH